MDEFNIDHSMSRYSPGEIDAGKWWALAHKCVLGLSLGLACQCALAQAMYRINALGTLSACTSFPPVAAGFNDADQVAGWACNAHGDFHAFLWKNNGTPMVDLGPREVSSDSRAIGINASGLVAGSAFDSSGYFAFESSGDGTPMRRIHNSFGGNSIEATGINDLGQVTGTAYTAGDATSHAYLWKNDGSPILDLGTLGGDYSFVYTAINASGQVAGGSNISANVVSHAFIWKNDGTPMLDLGTLGDTYGSSVALAIDSSGQVAGISDVLLRAPLRLETHAFFWRNDGTPMRDLGTLGGGLSDVVALNESGQIAGYSYTRGNNERRHAYVWMNDGTPMKDLGTLGGAESIAYDMNSTGQVTGYAYTATAYVSHAFVWRNDGTKIQDLNKLIDPTDPLKRYVIMTNGDFINDGGNIVAEGVDSRTGRAGLYLLQGTVLTLSPRSLTFGILPTGTSSAEKSMTVTNTSAKVIAVTSIAIRGFAPGQFASTNNCGASLVGHATCAIKVTFKPTTKGAKSAALNVNGGGGGLRSVALSGTGT